MDNIKKEKHCKGCYNIGLKPQDIFTQSASTSLLSNDSKPNSAITDPWVFDVQWMTYPQLEGDINIYMVFNPDFPKFTDHYGANLVDYAEIQVSPKNKGKVTTTSEFPNGVWTWNANASLKIDDVIEFDESMKGKPYNWTLSADSDEEYCIFIKWGASDLDYHYYCQWNFFTMPSKLSAPSAPTQSGKNICTTINDNDAWTTALEFVNTSPPSEPYNEFDDETRALFFEAACQNTESNLEAKYLNNKKFKIWSKETHTIGVNFMSSVTDEAKKIWFKEYVEQAVEIINETITSGFQLQVIDGITDGEYSDIEERNGRGELQLWWGTYEELWNESAPDDYRYFGEWSNDENSQNTYLTEGWIKLCTEKVWTMNYQGITWEEIVECLGIGNDIVHHTDTLWSDYWYPAKNLNEYGGVLMPYERDLNVLRLAYNNDLPSNIEPWKCANIICAPNGYFTYGHGYDQDNVEIQFDINMLNKGDTYYFRVISLDINKSSNFSSWVSFTIDGINLWNWQLSNGKASLEQTQSAYKAITKVDGYYVTDFSYLVWNDFVDKIQEFLDYLGVADLSIGEDKYGYSSTATYSEILNGAKMTSSDKKMTAKRFNIVRYVIGSWNSFASDSNSIQNHYHKTGNWDMSKNEVVYGEYFLDLAEYANGMIE